MTDLYTREHTTDVGGSTKIDNFALTMFQACPAKYRLRMIEGWTTRRKSAALGFGGALHEGLAAWYKTGDKVAPLQAIHEVWKDGPVDDYRTKEKCLSVMIDYMREYPAENFTIIGAPESPMVERSFTLSTGLYLSCQECGPSVDTNPPTINECANCAQPREEIEYGGIFDTLVSFGGQVYVLEHKSTSRLGDYYFDQFKPNNQVTGYCWGGGLLSGQRVGGAIINVLAVYKVGKTKFKRQITTRSKADTDTWLMNVWSTCEQIKDCERRNHWPWYTTSCTMYRKCEYHDVHVLGTGTEQRKRLENDYVIEPWSYEDRDDSAVEVIE